MFYISGHNKNLCDYLFNQSAETLSCWVNKSVINSEVCSSAAFRCANTMTPFTLRSQQLHLYRPQLAGQRSTFAKLQLIWNKVRPKSLFKIRKRTHAAMMNQSVQSQDEDVCPTAGPNWVISRSQIHTQQQICNTTAETTRSCCRAQRAVKESGPQIVHSGRPTETLAAEGFIVLRVAVV